MQEDVEALTRLGISAEQAGCATQAAVFQRRHEAAAASAGAAAAPAAALPVPAPPPPAASGFQLFWGPVRLVMTVGSDGETSEGKEELSNADDMEVETI